MTARPEIPGRGFSASGRLGAHQPDGVQQPRHVSVAARLHPRREWRHVVRVGLELLLSVLGQSETEAPKEGLDWYRTEYGD